MQLPVNLDENRIIKSIELIDVLGLEVQVYNTDTKETTDILYDIKHHLDRGTDKKAALLNKAELITFMIRVDAETIEVQKHIDMLSKMLDSEWDGNVRF